MLRAYCFASCLILHFIHCIMLTLANIQHFYALDQVYAEPEFEVQVERAQVEASTNLELDQGKSRCIPPLSLNFIYPYILFIILGCALGYRS
jgi:hypothetical protein